MLFVNTVGCISDSSIASRPSHSGNTTSICNEECWS